MSDLFEAVCETFAETGWLYRPVEGVAVIEADFEAYHTKVFLHVQVFAEIDTVSVVAEAPRRESDARFAAAIGELLMRANKNLSLGSFEMGYDTPKFFFRLSNIFPRGAYDRGIIASLVHTTVVEMDRMTPCVSIVEKTPLKELPGLNLSRLLEREDLLPAAGEEGR